MLAKTSQLERHLLGFDFLGSKREQRRLIRIGERDLDNLLAVAADGESEFAVAGAMKAARVFRRCTMPSCISSFSAR